MIWYDLWYESWILEAGRAASQGLEALDVDCCVSTLTMHCVLSALYAGYQCACKNKEWTGPTGSHDKGSPLALRIWHSEACTPEAMRPQIALLDAPQDGSVIKPIRIVSFNECRLTKRTLRWLHMCLSVGLFTLLCRLFFSAVSKWKDDFAFTAL
jgi:hypothetical protein